MGNEEPIGNCVEMHVRFIGNILQLFWFIEDACGGSPAVSLLQSRSFVVVVVVVVAVVVLVGCYPVVGDAQACSRQC